MPTIANIAHERSADNRFRTAILSSVADSASPFYHAILAKGEAWTDPQLAIDLSAIIGARQNKPELTQWFAALPKLEHPEKEMEGLARGLRLANNHNLQAPGVEQALTRLLSTGSEPVQNAAWEVSRYFKLDTLLHRAMQDASNANLAPERRIVAIRALRGGSFAEASPALRSILESHPAPEVEAAAVGSLSTFDEPAAAQAILDHWKGYSPAARKRAVDALLTQRMRIPMLLESGGRRAGGAFRDRSRWKIAAV